VEGEAEHIVSWNGFQASGLSLNSISRYYFHKLYIFWPFFYCYIDISIICHYVRGLTTNITICVNKYFTKHLRKWRSNSLAYTWRTYNLCHMLTETDVTPWPESASEQHRPSGRRLSAKLVPTFADRRCHMVSVTVPYGRILGFLDRNRYFFFQVAPQLYSRGWVDPVPDPILLRKSGSEGNRTRDLWICSQEFWPLDHRGGLLSST
jgi:hypothetical protein